MGNSSDHLRKRQLFEAWLSQHQSFATALSGAGQPLNVKEAVERIAHLVGKQGSAEYIYLLVEQQDGEEVPAYIGKSKTPVSRWTSHLKNLLVGEKSYGRWQARLLDEGQVRQPLGLYVIGQDQVQSPPIPGFPMTIGAIEYQLIGLAADAFVPRLLNSEGQAR